MSDVQRPMTGRKPVTVHDYLRRCGLNAGQIAALFEKGEITVNRTRCDTPGRELAEGDRPGVARLGALIAVSGLVELRPQGLG